MSRIVTCATRHHEAGFSLAEVLVTLVILAVGFLGLSAMTLSTIKSLTFSKELTTATMLAQDKIEDIQKRPYSEIMDANYPDEDYNTISPLSDYSKYKRVVTITPGSLANTKQIAVTTSWKSKETGRTHTVSLQTLIHN